MALALKLQLKEGQGVHVVNAPGDVVLDLPPADDPSSSALLLFARDRGELEAEGAPFVAAAREDRLAWVAYPKAGQLDTDLTRDRLWGHLRPLGIRPVRQVSIDEVWSAMRFRPG